MALDCIIEGGMSIKQAAKEYDVPFSTLWLRINGKHGSKEGRPTVLSANVEERLAVFLGFIAKWRCPMTTISFRRLVADLLKKLEIEDTITFREKNGFVGS